VFSLIDIVQAMNIILPWLEQNVIGFDFSIIINGLYSILLLYKNKDVKQFFAFCHQSGSSKELKTG